MSGQTPAGQPVEQDRSNLTKSISQILTELKLLEKPGEGEKVQALKGTPASLQVMTAGATSISKGVVAAVSGVGGLSAVAVGLSSFFDKVGGAGLDTELVRTAFILGGSLVIAAAAIGLAIVVRSDVTARAQVTAARLEARSAVTSAMLNNFCAPPVTLETPYAIRTAEGDDSWYKVEEFLWRHDGLAARVNGDVKPVDELADLMKLSDLQGNGQPA